MVCASTRCGVKARSDKIKDKHVVPKAKTKELTFKTKDLTSMSKDLSSKTKDLTFKAKDLTSNPSLDHQCQ